MAATMTCEICGGSGWRVVERDGMSAAARCTCQQVVRAEAALSAAMIPPLYENASVDNFLLPANNPMAENSMGKVLLDVRAYIRNFPATDKPGLLFIGDPGVGKTHLAVAVLRALLQRGFDGLFFDYQNLLERIRSSYDPMAGSSDREAYRSVLDAEILLLDDLGAHRVSDWVEDTVTSIVTWRCNHRKPTLVTTNLADADAGSMVVQKSEAGRMEYRDTLGQRIGARARSRLFEMCKVMKMPQVDDYRIRGGRTAGSLFGKGA